MEQHNNGLNEINSLKDNNINPDFDFSLIDKGEQNSISPTEILEHTTEILKQGNEASNNLKTVLATRENLKSLDYFIITEKLYKKSDSRRVKSRFMKIN